jgi:hypothetical protein
MNPKFFFAALAFIFGTILLGQPGPAIHTDGVDDVIDMGTSNAFAVSSSQSRSYLVDFKPQSYGGFLVSRYQNGSTSGSSFFITINPNGRIGVAGNGSNAIESNNAVVLNQWQRLIVTIDAGVGIANIYLNGVLDTTDFINLNSSVPTRNLTVGTRDLSATANLYDGSIDNLIIWNGVMTPTEVGIYSSSGTFLANCLPYAAHPQMIAKWSFEEAAGLYTLDSVSLQPGTLSVNTLWTNDTSTICTNSNIGLTSEKLDYEVTTQPNPNSGLFTIKVNQEHIGSSYQILDNLGRLIDKGIIRDLSQDFDLSDKPKGVYRIQVSNDKAIKTLNVVIQ